jgi:hypothetical protein
MTARARTWGVAVAMLSVAAGSCVEGPFEPFAPERDQPPLRFVGGAAPTEPFIWLAPVARTDSTVRLEVRTRNVPRLSAIAFELALDADVAAIDTIVPGAFFAPINAQPLVNVARDPENPRRWVGVITLPELTTASAGSGTLATVIVRRTTAEAFDVGVAFDTATSRAVGVGGGVVPLNWTRGRLIHVPRLP